MTAKKQCY